MKNEKTIQKIEKFLLENPEAGLFLRDLVFENEKQAETIQKLNKKLKTEHPHLKITLQLLVSRYVLTDTSLSERLEISIEESRRIFCFLHSNLREYIQFQKNSHREWVIILNKEVFFE